MAQFYLIGRVNLRPIYFCEIYCFVCKIEWGRNFPSPRVLNEYICFQMDIYLQRTLLMGIVYSSKDDIWPTWIFKTLIMTLECINDQLKKHVRQKQPDHSNIYVSYL